MSTLWITFLLLTGAALQTLFPAWAFVGSMEWPVLTGLIIYIALRAGRGQVIYAALLAGLLYDAFSPAPLGMALPFFLLLGIGLHALGEDVFADQIVTYSLLGLFAVLLKTVYFAVVLSASGLRPMPLGTLSIRLGGSLLLGVLTAPLVYLAVSLLHHTGSKNRRHI